MSHVIGLTGQSGAGKTLVSDFFVNEGFGVVNADKAARLVMEKGTPCLKEIEKAFEGVILENGELDRRKLAGIVFGNEEQIERLDSICYPYIINKIKEGIDILEKRGNELILLDAPTLFEARADEMCELIISVVAEKNIRTERVIKRDGITAEEADKRFLSQHTEEYFISRSDYIIENNGTETELTENARRVSESIKEFFNVRTKG